MHFGTLIRIFLLLTGPFVFLSAQNADVLLRETERAMARIQTISADFRQTKELPMLRHTLVLKGFFALDQTGGRLVWKVTDPIRYACVISGDTLTQWDADSGKEQTLSASGNAALKFLLHTMRAYFSGNFRAMAAEFDITAPEKDMLRLVPKKGSAPAQFIRFHEFYLSRDRSHVEKVRIAEHGGGITEILFTGVKCNGKLPEDIWKAKF